MTSLKIFCLWCQQEQSTNEFIIEIPIIVPMENLAHFREMPEGSKTTATSCWPQPAANSIGFGHWQYFQPVAYQLYTPVICYTYDISFPKGLFNPIWSYRTCATYCSLSLLCHVTHALKLCVASNSSFFGQEHVTQALQLIFPHICLL